MAFPKPNEQQEFKQIPPNKLYPAYIDQVVLLGTQRGSYMGKEKLQDKVYVRFVFPTERMEFERDGQAVEGPMILGSTYTFSYFQNSHLRRMMEGLLGRHMTAEEEMSYDIFQLVGKQCQVLVTEYTDHQGRARSQVGNVTPPVGEAYKPETPLIRFNPDDPSESNASITELRPWLQDRIEKRVHGEVMQKRAAAVHGKDQSALAEYEDMDDDIPF